VAVDRSMVRLEFEAVERSWDSTAAIVYGYALGVGAGAENPGGARQRVLPTFGVVVNSVRPVRKFADIDPAAIVHAEQSLELHASLPVGATS
jgi:hypothetical protein